jgi:hypothetical protein
MQHGENLEPKCDQKVGNISNFEDVSNLNLKIHHSFSLWAECEKEDIPIVSPSVSDKSVQDDVYQAPTNL